MFFVCVMFGWTMISDLCMGEKAYARGAGASFLVSSGWDPGCLSIRGNRGRVRKDFTIHLGEALTAA